MTLRNFLFLNTDEYGYFQVAADADSTKLGGLAMTGAITMATNKITGLGNGTDAQDAVTRAQLDAALAGLTWKEPSQVLKMKSDALRTAATGALVVGSGGTGIVSLTTTNSFSVSIDGETPVPIILASAPADRAAAIVAINSLYSTGGGLGGTIAVAGATDQIDIKSNTTGTGSTVAITSAHANWLEVGIVDATDAGTCDTPTATSSGEAWVVNGWGLPYHDGDIYEWSGSAWVEVLPGISSEPPDNTHVIVISSGAAGGFATYENKVAVYDAVGNHWDFTSPSDGWATLVNGEGSVLENMAFVYDGTPGGWIQFTGPASIPDATAASGGVGTKGKITVDSDYGLAVASGVLKIAITADMGLEFHASAKTLQVEANNAQAIHVDSAGVGMSINTAAGLEFDTNNLVINLEAAGAGTGGLKFAVSGDTGAVGILLQDTSPGLQLTADGLDTKLKAASGLAADADGLYVVGDADAGIVVSGKGVGIAIEATGADTGGLAFNLDGELRVNPNAAAGLSLTTDGLGVVLAAAGVGVGGLVFDLSGAIELDLDATDGALALSSDGLAVVIDNTTIGINGSNQLYVKGAGDATRVSYQFTAGAGGIVKGNAVYISAANTVLKADKDAALTAAAIGVAPLAITAGLEGTIVFAGVVTGVFSGTGVPGAPYFVTDAGVLSNVIPSGAAYVRRIGYAINTNDFLVAVGEVTKK